jgi:hypothetical protein
MIIILKTTSTVVLIGSESLALMETSKNPQAQSTCSSGHAEIAANYTSDMTSDALRSSASQPHFGFGFEEPDPLNRGGRLHTQAVRLGVDYTIA